MRKAVIGLGVAAVLGSVTNCGSSGNGSNFDPNDPNNRDGGIGFDFDNDGGGEAGPCVGLCKQQVSCPNGGTTSLSGHVYAPEGTIPLYNAIVYVPNAPLDPFPNGVQCDKCGKVSGAPLVSTLTNEKGEFKLTNVPVGSDIPVVIQIGKWRKKITVPSVAQCVDTPMAGADTRLPRSQTEGEMPKIAISSGDADSLECFLRKIGIIDGEFQAPGGAGAVHFFRGSNGGAVGPNGSQLAGNSAQGTDLWGNAATLKNYDIVVLSCEGSENPENKQAYYNNLLDYMNAGGKVFASHYHYVWFKSGPAPLPSTANWNNPPQSQAPYLIDVDFPKGNSFADWLVNVQATPTRGTIGLTAVRDSVGDSAQPPTSRRWIHSDKSSPNAKYFSFNTPIGVPVDQQCGRAVFSDVHVSGNGNTNGTFPSWCGPAGQQMSAQEKALLFLFFDLSSCVQDESKPPQPPGPK